MQRFAMAESSVLMKRPSKQATSKVKRHVRNIKAEADQVTKVLILEDMSVLPIVL
jgi:hypothetical protein